MTDTAQLPTMMQAVVCHGPRDYRLETQPLPTLSDGDILVKVEAVGICASDAKCFTGAPMFWGTDGSGGYCQPPITPGHEFSARIVGFGTSSGGVAASHPSRPDLKVGDLCVAEQIVPCRDCRYCDRGRYNLCKVHDIFGFRTPVPGAMAGYMKWPPGSRVHKVSASVDPVHAAFVEPLSCSVWAVERADVKLDDVVVVAGCGPLGLGMIAAARLKSPKVLVALDPVPWKLEVAKACGADVVLAPGKDDVEAAILAMTDGYGADVFIEASASPAAVQQGLQLLCKGGRFVEYSVFSKPTTVDWTVIGDTKELDIRGAHLGPNAWPTAIRMIERGQLPMDRIVTHVLPLAEYKRGFDMVVEGRENIKVVLKP
ncbi:alcohol dehydrogenase zinc-binding domain protein [Hyaloraphidium curvatum]|nr:alcohol dehydrogenase zinc-binding domain protein [Hyaloraphidium curvatum]